MVNVILNGAKRSEESLYHPETAMGGCLKWVPHQLAASLSSIGAGRAWGWLDHAFIVIQTAIRSGQKADNTPFSENIFHYFPLQPVLSSLFAVLW